MPLTSSRRAAAMPAAPPVPDRASNPRWTLGHWRCACWRSSGRRSRRPSDGPVVIDGAATLARRLERYRAALPTVLPPAAIDARDEAGAGRDLAARLAAAVDGEVIVTPEGRIVRCEMPPRQLPVDRARLATLPGQPPPDVPLVCLDTETTGLATAAGTAAFLVGLGWWEDGDRYRQVQLMLPDHGEERALLTAIEAAIPPTAWLVTYNGRGFDWPLLTTRFRLARRAAPVHAGHLDLLPVVRRRSVTDGRCAPADGGAEPSACTASATSRAGRSPVAITSSRAVGRSRRWPRSHATTTRTSGRPWLAHPPTATATPASGRSPPGDLAVSPARSPASTDSTRRSIGLTRPRTGRSCRPWSRRHRRPSPHSDPTTSRGGRQSDRPIRGLSGRRRSRPRSPGSGTRGAVDDRGIAVDRAHMLRRLGRHADAADAWAALAAGPGRTSWPR